MYVRFIVNTIDEGSQRRQGVIHAAWRLRNSD